MKNWRKRLFVSGILALTYLTGAKPVRADLVISGFAQIAPSNFAFQLYRYSDAGTYLGPIGNVSEESVDGLSVDSSGNVFAAGNTLGTGSLWKFSSGSSIVSRASQYGEPGGLAFGWNGRLFAPSSVFNQGSLSGVLEFNPATGAYVKNAIPIANVTQFLGIGFNASDSNGLAGFASGALYVEADISSPTTMRYRMQTNSSIISDSSFSIAAFGRIGFKHDDNTVFMTNGYGGHSIVKYDPTTGSALGNFLTLPSDGISDFAFAPDNSVFVLTTSAAPSVLHFGADGSPLGTVFTVPSANPFAAGPMVYMAVPEPASVFLLAPFIAMVIQRRRYIR